MEINAIKIKELRQKKGWTQQHLADACGVSLRTIQRVERYGNVSNETALSLSAVFELSLEEINQLPEITEPIKAPLFSAVHLLALIFVFGVITGVLISQVFELLV